MKSNYSMIFQRIIDSPYYNFRENTYLIMHTRSVEKHYKTRSRKKKKKKKSGNQFFSNFFSKSVDFTEKILIFPQKS